MRNHTAKTIHPDQTLQSSVSSDTKHSHAEDLAQKAAVAYFGQEILAWLNIPQKALAVAPTEHIRLDARHTYEDFNYIMENGQWYHFEFESSKVTRKTLKRFREYEAATSNVHDVDVVTYIICSNASQKLIEELNTGISTYRVRMILLKNFSVDKIFNDLQQKNTSDIQSFDLIPAAMSPLLGGTLSMKERVETSLHFFTRPYPLIREDQLKSLLSILLILAGKFLEPEEMVQLKEIADMTYLGQLIFNDGKQIGFGEGKEAGWQDGIRAMIQDNRSLGIARENIIAKLQIFFHLTEEKATEYFDKFTTN